MPFSTLTDEEERELYRLQRPYWREVLWCENTEARTWPGSDNPKGNVTIL